MFREANRVSGHNYGHNISLRVGESRDNLIVNPGLNFFKNWSFLKLVIVLKVKLRQDALKQLQNYFICNFSVSLLFESILSKIS